MVNKYNGWIILDKPSGITSAHAVGKVKRLLRPEKIGHAGTLDPLASGILPLALGEATKTVAYMMDAAKSYSFTVTWGEERDTDDCEGKTTQTSPKRPAKDDILAILPRFTGKIAQTPPHYSAIKVDGARSYDLARGGNAVELKAREVRVDRLEVAGDSWLVTGKEGNPPATNHQPLATTSFLCHCGKGTYIRSLARDMGRELGCFGHISRLRRLSVGNFDEKCAISLEVLAEMMHKGDLGFLQPVESALDDIPARELDSNQAMLLKRGQVLNVPGNMGVPQGTIVLARCEGKAVAMCSVSGDAMKPVRVFNL